MLSSFLKASLVSVFYTHGRVGLVVFHGWFIFLRCERLLRNFVLIQKSPKDQGLPKSPCIKLKTAFLHKKKALPLLDSFAHAAFLLGGGLMIGTAKFVVAFCGGDRLGRRSA